VVAVSLAAAAKGLVAHGARAAIVTAGAAGASLLVEGGEPRWHAAPRMEVQNPIGAGDALVGGLCVALERGDPLDRAIALGLATAAASVETAKAGAIDPARVEELAR
jgi:fructose-1-phosphate kinase PfkB-like protein